MFQKSLKDEKQKVLNIISCGLLLFFFSWLVVLVEKEKNLFRSLLLFLYYILNFWFSVDRPVFYLFDNPQNSGSCTKKSQHTILSFFFFKHNCSTHSFTIEEEEEKLPSFLFSSSPILFCYYIPPNISSVHHHRLLLQCPKQFLFVKIGIVFFVMFFYITRFKGT